MVAFSLGPTLVATARGDEVADSAIGADLAYSFTSRTEQLTTQDRLNQWDQVDDLVAERPVFGWGLGKEYEYYEPGRHEFLQVDITHNIGFDLLMRSGLIGFGFFLAALTLTLIKGWAAFLRIEDERLAALSLGLMAAISGLLAKGMVESIFEKYRLAITLALLIGMALSVAAELGRETEEAPAGALRRWPPEYCALLGVPEDGEHGADDDLQVEPGRPVLDVVVVPLDPVGERGLARAGRGPGPSP